MAKMKQQDKDKIIGEFETMKLLELSAHCHPGRLVEEVQLGDTDAVVAEIRGSAHITGVHEFIVDPRDPFQEGYLI